MKELIDIDGSKYEGGGAILRVACALSAITKKACRVFNIRKNRPKPGLMTQHLVGLQALAKLCNGGLEGGKLGSQEIIFYPGNIIGDSYTVKIETAGSITLVLQTLILPAIFAPTPVKINFDGGATDTFFSPTIDYFQNVFLKILEKMGVEIKLNILEHGYYPAGGARVEVEIKPSKLKKLTLTEKGRLKTISAISGASKILQNKKVAERQMAGAREILGKLKLPIEEKIEYYQTRCPGSQICLVAEFENTIIGTDNLGKFGKLAEDVGREAALELLKEDKSGACLDKHLTDQILPFMALAPSSSQVSVSEITRHCKTNMWVIEKFISGKFRVENALISWIPNP